MLELATLRYLIVKNVTIATFKEVMWVFDLVPLWNIFSLILLTLTFMMHTFEIQYPRAKYGILISCP